MSDRLWAANHLSISPSQPGQLSHLPSGSWTGNEYQPKCGDALWLGSLWLIPLVGVHVWVAGKTDPSLTNAVPEHLRDERLIIKRYTNKASLAFIFLYFSYDGQRSATNVSVTMSVSIVDLYSA